MTWTLPEPMLTTPEHGRGEAAQQWPAHFVAFGLTHAGRTDLTGRPYAQHRTALEDLFAERGLTAPFTLSPSTTGPDTAAEWLTWTAAGLEGGRVFQRPHRPHRPVRGWPKYKVRATTEATTEAVTDSVTDAVTGSLTAPRTVLPGRYDTAAFCTSAAAPPCPGPPATPSRTSSPRPETTVRRRTDGFARARRGTRAAHHGQRTEA